ncbi:hypothetical protein G4B88_020079 [Cannabis sativa]|uniref:CCHC-type domain-containing protein n=1 Tax=Cannabis sativa TaxID=3483 RepID=A0A7J6GLK8_CANSA|nr:hypothetical protein G4B88_020079 [Cannabis sativa]
MASSSSNVDNIEEGWKNIQLEEEEAEETFYEENEERDEEDDLAIDSRWCLVGRMLAGKVSDFRIFQNLMADLWKPGKGMYAKQLDQNRFLFQFYHELDIKRVIEGSPWTYDRKQLIITRLNDGDNPRTVNLNTLDLWLQIHDLQNGFMTMKVAKDAANYAGTFIESDPNNFTGVWREYLRVRVTLSLDLPLKRRMKFRKRDGDSFYATFRYESVPTFCFICGLMGHSERLCPRTFDTPPHLIVKPYGIGMKALPRRHQNFAPSPFLRSGKVATATFSPGVNTNQPCDNHGMPTDSVFMRISSPDISQSKTKNKGIMLYDSQNADVELTQAELKRKRFAAENKNGPAVEVQGHKGGLALLWRFNDGVRLLGFSHNHIDIEIAMPNSPLLLLFWFTIFASRMRGLENLFALKSSRPAGTTMHNCPFLKRFPSAANN